MLAGIAPLGGLLMKRQYRFAVSVLLLLFAVTASTLLAQQRAEDFVPRTKEGKKLLTATDLMKINSVGNPHISPDGSRVIYTVSETKMEKDKEWKTVTQIWMVPTTGGRPRQFTRGDKNA